MTTIKIAFCDNDNLSIESVKILLKKIPEVRIVGEYDSAQELISYVRKPYPDVIIYDLLNNSNTDFIHLQNIISKYPDCKIIIVSTFEDFRTIITAFKVGVKAFLLKRELSFNDLSEAITQSYKNLLFISTCSEYNIDNINKIIQLNYTFNTLNWM